MPGFSFFLFVPPSRTLSLCLSLYLLRCLSFSQRSWPDKHRTLSPPPSLPPLSLAGAKFHISPCQGWAGFLSRSVVPHIDRGPGRGWGGGCSPTRRWERRWVWGSRPSPTDAIGSCRRPVAARARMQPGVKRGGGSKVCLWHRVREKGLSGKRASLGPVSPRSFLGTASAPLMFVLPPPPIRRRHDSPSPLAWLPGHRPQMARCLRCRALRSGMLTSISHISPPPLRARRR